MRVLSLITVLSITLSLSVSSSSQIKKKSGRTRDICDEALSRGEMDRCDYRIFQEAEKGLNQVYERLRSRLDESQKSDLEHSQQEWLKFRDANCQLASDFVYRQCMTRMTRERADELRDFRSRFTERR